ncbi:hypothetical protein AAG906_013423 [Vitis piasezkii]
MCKRVLLFASCVSARELVQNEIMSTDHKPARAVEFIVEIADPSQRSVLGKIKNVRHQALENEKIMLSIKELAAMDQQQKYVDRWIDGGLIGPFLLIIKRGWELRLVFEGCAAYK